MNNRQNALQLPDRWLNCPNVGSVVFDLFLPFKTPLDSKYRSNIVDSDQLWEPDMVVEYCRASNIELGCVIDLTFSKRYYSPGLFKPHNIQHHKIVCRGHNESPEKEAVDEFVSVCNQFTQKYPNKKIGVHCTHGFNRTGFMICAYVLHVQGWALDAAVLEFQKARPPGIYKQDYLADLAKEFGDPEEPVPQAAAKPTWEDVPVVRGPRGNAASSSKEFMAGVRGVHLVTDDVKVREIQEMAAAICDFEGSGFPGSQPISMDADNLLNLRKEHHVVSWKADGTRYMMVIAGRDEVYFLDRDNAVFKIDNLTFPRRSNSQEHLSQTLLDGEMVIDDDGGKPVPRYLIYDIVGFEDVKIRECSFDTRTNCIAREIIDARKKAEEARLINKDHEPFRVRIKPFFDVSVTEKFFGEKFRKQISHEVDGLIFQPSGRPYVADRCKYILKWKPPELNTIDFRLKVTMETGEGMLPKTCGFLYVGGLEVPYGKLANMSKKLRKLDGKIVECKMDPEKRGWLFLRERTDKSFPNGIRTAKGVQASIDKPVTKKILFDFIATQAIKRPDWLRCPQPRPMENRTSSNHCEQPPPKRPCGRSVMDETST